MDDNISQGYDFEKANMKINEISFSSSKNSFENFTVNISIFSNKYLVRVNKFIAYIPS